MSKKTEVAIFDLDGTMYDLGAASFQTSNLWIQVRDHHLKLITDIIDTSSPESVFLELCEREKTSWKPISMSLAALASKTRQEVFELTWWRLRPSDIITGEKIIPEFLSELRQWWLRLVLLTAGPSIWAHKALEYLGIKILFDEIITAEMYSNGKWEVFNKFIADWYFPETIVSIGDQIYSDILPAQGLGISTCHVSGPRDIYLFFAENIWFKW